MTPFTFSGTTIVSSYAENATRMVPGLRDLPKMAGALLAAGCAEAPSLESADLIVINSCAIREAAEQKVIGRMGHLGRLKQANPGLRVVLTGCSVREPDRAGLRRRYPAVDLFLRAFLRVDLLLFSIEAEWEFATITLFEFEFTCQLPEPASQAGDTVTLHMGPLDAAKRLGVEFVPQSSAMNRCGLPASSKGTRRRGRPAKARSGKRKRKG